MVHPLFPILGRRISPCLQWFQWDSMGVVSGGCQDIYTVIPNSSATAQNPATCKNVTLPTSPLQVDAAVVNGAFSQYGWIPQVR
jgi:hypothetical protein